MEDMKKNVLTYTVPALMAAALIFTAAWGFSQKTRAKEFEKLSDEYAGRYVSACTRCGRELVDSVTEMTTTLKKLKVTSSRAGRVLALEDIVRESAEASQLLSRVPQPAAETIELAKFIRRAGDYARTLSRGELTGKPPDASDAEQLESILSACSALAEKLASDAENGNMPIGTEDYDNYDLRDGAEPYGQELPTLVYDGMFSDSAENVEPRGLTGENGTPEQAAEKARELFGMSFTCSGETGGNMPCYELVSEDGTAAELTVRGLWPVSFMSSPEGGESGVPEREEYERLAAVGLVALSRLGYPDMTPTFAQYYDGEALIRFVWTYRGVPVYGDLIKVWIDRETGKLIGLDARGYLVSHTEREWHEPALSAEEARKSVSEALAVTGSPRLALLPVTPLTETLCWAFTGECAGEEYIVCINADTGAEERVFIVVNDGNGSGTV